MTAVPVPEVELGPDGAMTVTVRVVLAAGPPAVAPPPSGVRTLAAVLGIVVAMQRWKDDWRARGMILWFAAIFIPLLMAGQQRGCGGGASSPPSWPARRARCSRARGTSRWAAPR